MTSPTALVMLAMAAPAHAETKLEITQRCVVAIEAGDRDTVTELAEEILSWGATYSPAAREAGTECITSAKGEPWQYVHSLGAFVTGEELAQIMEERRLEQRQSELKGIAENLLAKSRKAFVAHNESLVTESTERACTSLYEAKGDAAFLNPVCRRHYIRLGHPDLKGYLEFTIAYSEIFAEQLSRSDKDLIKDLSAEELASFCEGRDVACVAATILSE